MYIAHQFHDMELTRIMNLPIGELLKWYKYFIKLNSPEQITGTSNQVKAQIPKQSGVSKHAIQFK